MERWKQNLYTTGIAQIMGFGSLTFVLSFLPLYLPLLGVNESGSVAKWSGVLMGAAAFFAAITGPIWGRLGDKYGRKVMVERTLICNTLLIGMMAFTTNPWQMLALRSLQGAMGGLAASSIALVTSMTPVAQAGFALGFYQFAMTTGNTLGPLFGGYVSDSFSFKAAFFAMAGSTLFGAVLVRFGVKEKFVPVVSTDKQDSLFTSFKLLLKEPALTSMLFVNFLVQYSLIIAAPITPLFIRSINPDSSHVTTLTGMIIAAGGVSSALAAIAWGRVSDRRGPKTILIICSFGSAVASLLQIASVTTWQFLVLRIIAGFFAGGMIPCANSLINRLIPAEQKGTAFGIVTSFSMLGIVFGPISGGVIGASPAGYHGVFGFTALLLLITAVWVLRTVRVQT